MERLATVREPLITWPGACETNVVKVDPNLRQLRFKLTDFVRWVR